MLSVLNFDFYFSCDFNTYTMQFIIRSGELSGIKRESLKSEIMEEDEVSDLEML